MISSTVAGDKGIRQPRLSHLASVMTITDAGLALGATVLAPVRRDGCGTPALAIDGAEERILALIAVAYGKAVGPAVLGNIRRASACWSQGETVLAAIELALSGLAPLRDEEAVALRLSLGDRLLAAGIAPRDLVKACGLEPVRRPPQIRLRPGPAARSRRRSRRRPVDLGWWRTRPPEAAVVPADYRLVVKEAAERREGGHTAGRRADLGRRSADAADRATSRRLPPSLCRRPVDRVIAAVRSNLPYPGGSAPGRDI